MTKMDNYEQFKKCIDDAADSFKAIDSEYKSGPVRVVSHLDSDGISSAAIIIRALENEGLQYELSIIQQLSTEMIDSIAKEDHKIIFFTDLGSGNIEEVHNRLRSYDKKIFILDHHEIASKKEYGGIVHVNPHLFDIDGGKEISGAGTVFLFAKELNPKNEMMAHIAIIGAIGDIQENNGFSKLNQEILSIAEKNKLIKVKKGLKMFGRSRALHKVLEYSSEPYIPGASGNESGAIQLLHEAGIYPLNVDTNGNSKTNDFKRLMDLTEDEEKRLASAIIMRRLSEKNPEDIFGFNYALPNETFDNLKDAKEFSTLLNASGRMNNASLGIGVCLGDEKIKRKAISNLTDYKKEIVMALNWFNESKKSRSDDIQVANNYMIINAKDRIRSTIAGTLASIISKSNDYKRGLMILSMARSDDGIKASLRIVGENNVDLRDILKELVEKTGGETGGHKNAAGAIIPHSKEAEFIDYAKKILSEKIILPSEN